MPMGGGGGRAPMLVLNPNTKREGEDGHKVQTQNVGAAKVHKKPFTYCVNSFDALFGAASTAKQSGIFKMNCFK